MKRVGEILKEEREKKSLSIHEIGMSLKINPKVLQAIEDNDEPRLPAKTFLRGFVRSYAQYLKLNIDEIMLLFQSEVGSTRPSPQQAGNRAELPPNDGIEGSTPEPQPEKEQLNQNHVKPTAPEVALAPQAPKSSKEKTPKTPPYSARINQTQVMGALLICFLILLIFVVSRLIDKYQKERILSQTQTLSDSIAETNPLPPVTTENKDLPEEKMDLLPTSGQQPPPIEKLQTEKLPEANKSEAGGPGVGRAETSVLVEKKPESTPTAVSPLDPQKNAPPGLPKPLPADEVVKKPDPVPPAQDAPPLPTTETPPAALIKPVEVIVEAFNKVQIRYHFGDSNWKTMDLEPGRFHTFKSKSNLKMELNDGGSVSLIVNGRDRGIPGQIGKPLKLSYPQ